MIKKISLLLLAFIMLLSSFTVFSEESSQNAGNDIWKNASNWALVELNPALDAGLVPQALYTKDFTEDITRLEFAALSVTLYEKLSGKTIIETKSLPFSDTDDLDVNKAYNAGFTTGISETEFGVEAKLTREQASTMISRVYKKYKDENWKIAEDYSFELASSNKFSDDASISEWAKNSVYFMSENEIIKGTGKNEFSPVLNMSRESAVIVAYRIFTKYSAGSEENKEESNAEDDTREPFVIAFIGGSLTEGGTMSWIKTTREYLQEKMPDRKVTTVNAGIGGTMSDYGMLRYQSHVLSHQPDMVFIEFSSNDRNMHHSEAFQKVGFESMVRQSLNAKKVPYIVLFHSINPTDKGTESNNNWLKGVKMKDSIASAYGIKSINAYDYAYDVAYQNAKKEKPELTFMEYLDEFYNKSGDEYDVHGGYKLYGEAIVKAFEEDYEGSFTQPKKRSVVYTAGASDINAKYTALPINHSRMNYTKGWEIYNAQNRYIKDGSGFSFPENRYWIFPNGIRVAAKPATSVQAGFYSKAKAICLPTFTPTKSIKPEIYVDDVLVKTITARMDLVEWVELPNDGKEHRVVIKVPVNTDGVFGLGCVYEKN